MPIRHDCSVRDVRHSDAIHRATDPGRSPIQYMRIYLGRLDVAVSKQLLDGPDIIAVLEEMGSEGMPEGMAADSFGNTGAKRRFMDGALEERRVHVVTPLLSCLSIAPSPFLGEDPLPCPIGGAFWIFPVEGSRQDCRAPALA